MEYRSLNNIVHLVDPTSGMDVLDTIALAVNCVPGTHHVLIFGHNGWLEAAIEAGIPKKHITWNRTLARCKIPPRQFAVLTGRTVVRPESQSLFAPENHHPWR